MVSLVSTLRVTFQSFTRLYRMRNGQSAFKMSYTRSPTSAFRSSLNVTSWPLRKLPARDKRTLNGQRERLLWRTMAGPACGPSCGCIEEGWDGQMSSMLGVALSFFGHALDC